MIQNPKEIARPDAKSLREIKELRDKIGDMLQLLENFLYQDKSLLNYWLNKRSMRIQFPRGYIRRVIEFEQRMHFIRDGKLRKNIAYTFQFTDLIRWLINRFDIGLTLFDMLTKIGIITLASIAEAMCYGFLQWYTQEIKPKINMPKKFSGMINLLAKSEKIIDLKLLDDLEWLRDKRNNIHLWRADREYQAYDISDYNRAVQTVQKLEAVLCGYWEKY